MQNAFVPVTIIIQNAEKSSSDSCTKCGYTDPLFSCSKQTHPVGRSMAFCRLLPGQNAGRPRQGAFDGSCKIGSLWFPQNWRPVETIPVFPGLPKKRMIFDAFRRDVHKSWRIIAQDAHKTAENLVKNALAHMEWGGRMRKSGQPAKRLEEKIYAVTKKHEADGGGRPGPEYGSLYSSGTCIGWLYH
ncbi:hypothetical protein [Faecalibacterium sp. 9]|uniref:hypothetical protein n=1 Tax=Faecalibacterium sp. 9 TaxID=3402018 RepID=UPI003AAD367D